jgi:hypothetical protein
MKHIVRQAHRKHREEKQGVVRKRKLRILLAIVAGLFMVGSTAKGCWLMTERIKPLARLQKQGG